MWGPSPESALVCVQWRVRYSSQGMKGIRFSLSRPLSKSIDSRLHLAKCDLALAQLPLSSHPSAPLAVNIKALCQQQPGRQLQTCWTVPAPHLAARVGGYPIKTARVLAQKAQHQKRVVHGAWPNASREHMLPPLRDFLRFDRG
jgi:hypothetical protein